MSYFRRIRVQGDPHTCQCKRGKKHRNAALCKCINERTNRLRYFVLKGGKAIPVPARVIRDAARGR